MSFFSLEEWIEVFPTRELRMRGITIEGSCTFSLHIAGREKEAFAGTAVTTALDLRE